MQERPFSDISFRQYLDENILMGSRCKECGTIFTPPKQMCNVCYKSAMEWLQMSGTGKLAAFTCITVAPQMMIDEGFGRSNPYCVGVIELDEGTRVVARIVGVDPKEPEGIKVGTPMHVQYLHRDRGKNPNTFLAFEVD